MTKTAGLLPRVVARTVDLLVATIAVELLNKTGLYAGLIYLLISDGLFNGRSPGKMVAQLRVVKEDGTPCTVRESLIRNLVITIAFLLWRIPLIGWVLFLSVLALEFVILFGSNNGRRFGDEAARTFVVEAGEEVEGRKGRGLEDWRSGENREKVEG